MGIRWRDMRRLLRRYRADYTPRTLRRLGQIAWVAGLARLAASTPADRSRPSSELQPVFIVGHWRSGTSILQRLIACDRRFATPTFMDCTFPWQNGALARWFVQGFSAKLPPTRGFDAFPLSPQAEFEDEFALLKLTLESPLLAYAFPRQSREIWRTCMEAPPSEEWRLALRRVIEELARRAPLQLLKSPAHAFRLATLAEAFPQARFIDIRREPGATFMSTCHLERHLLENNALQVDIQLDEAFVAQRMARHARAVDLAEGLPGNRFARIAFDELIRRPRQTLDLLLERLELGPYRPDERRFVEIVRGFGGSVRERQVPEEARQLIKKAFEQAGARLQ